MAARGDTRGLVQTLTAAGISERNVRYGELIRRREARREAEAEPKRAAVSSAVDAALQALRDDQRQLARDSIDLADLEDQLPIERSEDDLRPPAADDEDREAQLLAWVAGIAAMSPEAVEAQQAELDARDREIADLIREELGAASK